MAIKSYRNAGTEDVAKQRNTKEARRVLPTELHRQALKRLVEIDAARELHDLGARPSNRLEKLAGDRAGQYSIRVNWQYRLCFKWQGADAYEVELVDYHRG